MRRKITISYCSGFRTKQGTHKFLRPIAPLLRSQRCHFFAFASRLAELKRSFMSLALLNEARMMLFARLALPASFLLVCSGFLCFFALSSSTGRLQQSAFSCHGDNALERKARKKTALLHPVFLSAFLSDIQPAVQQENRFASLYPLLSTSQSSSSSSDSASFEEGILG